MWRDASGWSRAVILGLETSCDETAAALVTRDGDVLANVVASQAELHAPFGGVVPEVAARRHLELVDARRRGGPPRGERDTRRRRARRRHARTRARRRAARRTVGGQGARLGALRCRSPPSTTCTATWRRSSSGPDPVEPPFVCLLATGGHTMVLEVTAHDRYTVLGRTLDDAAGEAFDKGARLLGSRLSRAAAELERLARDGDPAAFSFPVASASTASTSRSPA